MKPKKPDKSAKASTKQPPKQPPKPTKKSVRSKKDNNLKTGYPTPTTKRPPKVVELGTGDRVSWRSGQTVFVGIVQTAVPAGTTNDEIRSMLNTDLPAYLVNLGRDVSKEVRVVVSATHKQAGEEWQAYDKPRIKAVTAPTLSKQLLLFRKGKQRKDREPGGAEIVWVVAPVPKPKPSKREKKQNDPLDFSDFEAPGDNDVFIAGLD